MVFHHDLEFFRFFLIGKFWNGKMAEPLDHATGIEKAELLAHLAGNDVSDLLFFSFFKTGKLKIVF